MHQAPFQAARLKETKGDMPGVPPLICTSQMRDCEGLRMICREVCHSYALLLHIGRLENDLLD